MKDKAVWVSVAVLLSTCAPARVERRYELTGQILSVDEGRREVVIRHEDIPGFMPAMTMPFGVKDATLISGRAPGDRVKAILVVTETSAWLERLEKIGSAPLPAETPAAAEAGSLRPGDAVPDAAFVDQEGRPQRFSAWRGRAVALTFIFTRCPFPDFCPALDRGFVKLQALVKADATLRDRVRLLTVSFDPEYDTPPVLKEHATHLGADPALWLYLTAPAPDIDDFGRHFGLSVQREGQSSGVTHNLRTAVIDPSGKLVQIWRGAAWNPEDVAAALRKALSG